MNFRIILIILSLTQSISAQVDSNDYNRLSLSLLTREFPNLNHGIELFDKYPNLKSEYYNTILGCIILLRMQEIEIKNVAISRLTGISTQLFNEGNPVLLTYGMNSIDFANKKNERLDDDNGVIYVSIADYIVSESESKAQSVFNAQTNKLLKKKNGL